LKLKVRQKPDELSAQAVTLGRMYYKYFGIVRDKPFCLGNQSGELGDERVDIFGFLLMFTQSRGIDFWGGANGKRGPLSDRRKRGLNDDAR
jgi:hypothetical protein